jgi:DsbC/DsbD-like thiol-disulfide interchange protein
MVAAIVICTCAGARMASADDASRWDGDARSAARLIAGSQPAPRSLLLRAGIEIRLKSGWHTYWRYPGDFAASQNVKSVDVAWPTPQRLIEDGLTSIGYDRDVILPLRITPRDPAKPVTLRLKLDYAICEKLCVPAQAQAELALLGGPSTEEGALQRAEARVPKKLAQVGAQDGALAVRAVKRESGAEHGRVLIDIAGPADAPLEVFAEGPTPDWSLPVPIPVEGAPAGLQRFAFDLDGAPPGIGYDGALVTLTVASPDQAIEVPFRLE